MKQKTYKQHKGSVRNRKDRTGALIEFKLTYEEWLDIWLQSGKLHLRGRGKGKYCMCRKDDLGHYEVGNVYIDTFENNTIVRNQTSPTAHTQETKEKIRAARSKQILKDSHHDWHRKTVETPDGIFRSLRDAGKYYGITGEAMGWRVKNKEGYAYV